MVYLQLLRGACRARSCFLVVSNKDMTGGSSSLSEEAREERVHELEEERNLLFSRLADVFSLSPSRLEKIFLRSSEEEFQDMKKMLMPTNSDCCSGGVGSECDEYLDSSGRLRTHSQGRIGEYVRPVLPERVPSQDPHGDEYHEKMLDILHHVLSNRDVYMIQQVVVEYPKMLLNMSSNDLGLVLQTIQSPEVLRVILKEGIDPNTSDKHGGTLLHRYVHDKSIECIQILLEFGANCNIEDTMNHRSALQLAALQGDFEVLNLLVSASKVQVKLESPDFDGNSLLHLVMQSEHPNAEYKSLTMFLLDLGLSPSAKNLHGETPLHYFCGNQNLCGIPFIEPLFEMLLEYVDAQKGCGVNLMDNDGCTPLIIACAHREWELCKLLIRSGADMNIPCPMSSRLLVRGCDTSKSEVVDFESDCTTSDLMPRSVRSRLFPHISSPQSLIDANSRDRCMNCAALFEDNPSSFSLFNSNRKFHCKNCGRVVCSDCMIDSDIPFHALPAYLKNGFDSGGDIKACNVCHPLLTKDIKIAKFW